MKIKKQKIKEMDGKSLMIQKFAESLTFNQMDAKNKRINNFKLKLRTFKQKHQFV